LVFFSAAGDINAPASAQANKTFLPWETHLFTRLLKYGMQSVKLFLNVISEVNEEESLKDLVYPSLQWVKYRRIIK